MRFGAGRRWKVANTAQQVLECFILSVSVPSWTANPGGKFEVLFRVYGPEKALFDKTWKLPDIEKVAAQ
jgi:hypothetical protein